MTPRDIAALKREIFSSLRCALPGTVESFDPVTQTAVVRPALSLSSHAYPVIHDVPAKDARNSWEANEVTFFLIWTCGNKG